MKENQFWRVRGAAWNALHFYVMPLHSQLEALFLVAHFMRIANAGRRVFRSTRARPSCIESRRYRKLYST